MDRSPHILLLLGSVRDSSLTKVVLLLVEERLRRLGATTSLWDPRERPLEIAQPQRSESPGVHGDWLLSEANRSDALVLGSPLYHNSFSGVLKNALDHLRIPHLAYKPVLLIGQGGYRSPQAVDQLRTVVRGFLAIPAPTAVCSATTDFNTEGPPTLVDDQLVARIDRAAAELALLTVSLQPFRGKLMKVAARQ